MSRIHVAFGALQPVAVDILICHVAAFGWHLGKGQFGEFGRFRSLAEPDPGDSASFAYRIMLQRHRLAKCLSIFDLGGCLNTFAGYVKLPTVKYASKAVTLVPS